MSALYAGTVESYIVKKFITDGDIVFDVGANKGEWTDLVLRTCSSTQLHLFEPLKYYYEELLQKFKDTNISIINKAVYRSEGHVKFCEYPDDCQGLSSIYRRVIAEKNQYVPLPEKPEYIVLTTTIGKYCWDKGIFHINYLKIDVEGAEFDVIKGASKMLNSGVIDYVEFEYGGTFLDSNITLEDVYNYLRERDYQIFKCFDEHLEHLPEFSSKYEDYGFAIYIALSPKVKNER